MIWDRIESFIEKKAGGEGFWGWGKILGWGWLFLVIGDAWGRVS